jgi:hypothetical protein
LSLQIITEISWKFMSSAMWHLCCWASNYLCLVGSYCCHFTTAWHWREWKPWSIKRSGNTCPVTVSQPRRLVFCNTTVRTWNLANTPGYNESARKTALLKFFYVHNMMALTLCMIFGSIISPCYLLYVLIPWQLHHICLALCMYI